MHAVMRTYSGDSAKKFADLLEQRKDEIEKTIRGVSGFVSWGLMRTANGCMTFTVCKDKAGCDQSVSVAREWAQKNASNIGAWRPDSFSSREMPVHS